MSALEIDSMQGLSYTKVPTTAPRSTPYYRKSCCASGATSLSNSMTWAVTTVICAQYHHASVLARVTKDRAQA